MECHDSDADSYEEYAYDIVDTFITDIESTDPARDEVFTQVRIKAPGKDDNNPKIRRTLKVKVDTGAQGNTLPLY